MNDAAASERICVYTALFDGYDELRPPAYKPPGVDFICFSDKPLAAAGWEVRQIELPGSSAAMKNRRLKILPYEILSEYDCSLYLDSNLVLLGDLSRLYSLWLRGQPFVAWRHPQRCSVFDELYVLLASARTDPSRIIDQFVFFSEQGVPDYVPMIEANFLWRDHRDTQVRMLMERLWDHLTGFQSWRVACLPHVENGDPAGGPARSPQLCYSDAYARSAEARVEAPDLGLPE